MKVILFDESRRSEGAQMVMVQSVIPKCIQGMYQGIDGLISLNHGLVMKKGRGEKWEVKGERSNRSWHQYRQFATIGYVEYCE